MELCEVRTKCRRSTRNSTRRVLPLGYRRSYWLKSSGRHSGKVMWPFAFQERDFQVGHETSRYWAWAPCHGPKDICVIVTPRISSAEASRGENLKLAFTLEVKCPPIMPYSDFPVVDFAASPIYETSTYAIRDTLLLSCDLL